MVKVLAVDREKNYGEGSSKIRRQSKGASEKAALKVSPRYRPAWWNGCCVTAVTESGHAQMDMHAHTPMPHAPVFPLYRMSNWDYNCQNSGIELMAK